MDGRTGGFTGQRRAGGQEDVSDIDEDDLFAPFAPTVVEPTEEDVNALIEQAAGAVRLNPTPKTRAATAIAKKMPAGAAPATPRHPRVIQAGTAST